MKNVKKYFNIDENFLKNFKNEKKEEFLNLDNSYNEIVSDYITNLNNLDKNSEIKFIEKPKMLNIKHNLVLPNNVE